MIGHTLTAAGADASEASMYGEGPGGGMMKHPIPGAPSAWLAYVQVDDLAASTAKAKSLGAQVMKDITEVPDMGHFSILIDPTGAPIALWQSKTK